MVESNPTRGFGFGLEGRRNSDKPDSLRSSTVGMDMPPAGPNVADFNDDSMCGEDVECFKALLWSIGGNAGDCGASSVVALTRSVGLVFRLNWLGFRFMAGIVGLIKEGEEVSKR